MPSVKQASTIDAKLVSAISHPLRARILTVLAERPASPKGLSIALRAELSDCSYHVRKLRDLGVIELIDTEPVRGSLLHVYRAVVRPSLTYEEQWLLAPEERLQFAREICQLGFADAAAALGSEDFCGRYGYCAVRAPVQVDQEGWDELSALYDETSQKTLEIEAKSAARRAKSGEESIAAEGLLLLYQRATAAALEQIKTD